MAYTPDDHLEHLRAERLEFEASHTRVCWCCWHSFRPDGKWRNSKVKWICHHCGRKVSEVWMDFIDIFEKSGLVRGRT